MDNDLLVLLYDVARGMRTRADQWARQIGMTRAQWVVLIRLSQSPGLSQRELATLAEVEPITIARLIDRLVAHGLVERRPDPDDRRIWRLHVTEAAGPALAVIETYRNDLRLHMSRSIDPALLQAMETVLRQMKANLSQPARPGEDSDRETA
jgi:DNA-binding MarR family transcriptional regulator